MRETIAIPAPASAGPFVQFLERARAWFGDAKPTERELADLTEEQLDDLGIDAASVRRHVAVDPIRLGLLDLGWQSPPPRRRR